MIPIRASVPVRRFPIITVLFILINVVVFMYELSLGRRLQQAFYVFGFTPALIGGTVGVSGAPPMWWPYSTIVTSMFFHGGWMHLLGNMYFLWIFGGNVEDRLGRLRYVGFYLLTGFGAMATHFVTNMSSVIPTVGASGSISGVLGAYFLLYPRARVLTLIPIWFFLHFIEIPAFIFIGLWFLTQFFYGFMSVAAAGGQVGGVAWWAHVGGFVTGIALVWSLRSRRPRITMR